MPPALRLPGVGKRRGLGAVRGFARPPQFPWLSDASLRKLAGARTRDGWIDSVSSATGYTQAEKDALTENIFRTKVRAYEDRVTSELRRTGSIKKGQRWRMASDDYTRTAMWAESEKSSIGIADTYDKDRDRWAKKMKKTGGRKNRYVVAREFDDWNEGRAVWKAKQVSDSEMMVADMRAGDEMYRESGIANPKRDKAWYWLTTASGSSSINRRTTARGKGKGRKAGKTKRAEGPCKRCRAMQRKNPYTRRGLVKAAKRLGAWRPKHFVMHANERCTVEFRPGGQKLRSRANRDKATRWAEKHGTITGVA